MLSKIGPISPAIGTVSIGGGTGLSRLLSGLKHFVRSADSRPASPTPSIERLAAVVTVTDGGGSSGRLRREFRIPPPGDIRKCMSAIFDARMALDRLQRPLPASTSAQP